jgi:hypothetical protein
VQGPPDTPLPTAPDTTQTHSTNCAVAAADALAKHTAAVAHWNDLTAFSVQQAALQAAFCTKVRRCRLTVSNSFLNAPMVSALNCNPTELHEEIIAFKLNLRRYTKYAADAAALAVTAAADGAIAVADVLVGHCSFAVSRPQLKSRMVSAIELKAPLVSAISARNLNVTSRFQTLRAISTCAATPRTPPPPRQSPRLPPTPLAARSARQGGAG